MSTRMTSIKRCTLGALFTLSLATAPLSHAHGPSDLSAASALSVLPVAMSVAAPMALVAGAASLTVVATEASLEGMVLIVERASDGARATLRFSGKAIGGASLAAGTAISVTALASGWLLVAAGQAIAFVPNEVGAALLYNERISR